MNLGNSSSSSDGAKNAVGTASVNILPAKDSKVSIYMSSDAQNEITWPTKMFPTDKMVRVTSGESEVEIEGSTAKVSIESLSELAYKWKIADQHTFELLNGYAWLDTPNGDMALDMKFFSGKFAPGSIVIASQNTRASNLYVIKWEVEIKTEGGSARVASGQMISLLQSETKNGNIGDKLMPLDDFVKQSSIFKRKDGASLLASSDLSSMSGSSTASWTVDLANTPNKVVSITYPEDQMTVDSDKVTIEGKILSPNIKKITIGKQEAKILAEQATFTLKDYTLIDDINFINYRAFDEAGVVIETGVVTVNLNPKKVTQKKPDVISYPVSSKDFKIQFPSENPYKTTDSAVKIRGSFAPDVVKYIKVNNYQLQQFRQFGTNWTYNASIDNGNMEEGVNEYLITYYGTNDDILYTSKIYIVKEQVPVVPILWSDRSPTTSSPAPLPPSNTTSSSTGSNL